LVRASDPIFQPPLADFFIAVIAHDRPPAAPDPNASATLSTFSNYNTYVISFKTALACHPTNAVWPMPTFEYPIIQPSSSTPCSLMNYCIESAPGRFPCLALLGGEILPLICFVAFDVSTS